MSEVSGENNVPGSVRRRPQFGTRFLKDKKNVFEHNAWDNVVWDETQEATAREKVQENSEVTLAADEIHKLDQEAATQWDKFYDIHQNRFFKDRNWLFTEFPELAPHLAHTFPQKQNPGDPLPDDHSGEVLESAQEKNGGAKQNNDDLEQKNGDAEQKNDDLEKNDNAEQRNGDAEQKNDEKQNNDDLEQKNGNAEQKKGDEKVENSDANTEESIKEKVGDSTLETNEETSERNPITVVAGSKEKQEDAACVPPESKRESTSDTKESYPGESATFRVLEVGCGVGNTVFPILSVNNDEGLFVYCCDFSSTAVGLVKESADYNEKRCHAFVCDVTSEDWEAPFPESSLDAIVCIFVLSALHPDKLEHVVKKMSGYLRPGGLILFRDYGRYDLAQLRFKKGRCLAENFYVRGDGTRCYFFTQEEVRELMMGAGLVEEQNLVDRRLQVNRGKQLTMYRVWVQAKYRKPRDHNT